MTNAGVNLIQAIEWKKGMPVDTGSFPGVNVIHCVEDGDITAHFKAGDETRSFIAGDDFVLAAVDVTVVSGSFDLN